jgi:plasmid stabilization system protein ParE
MIIHRSEEFEADLERQFRWYLLETGLDDTDALALATRFAQSVDSTLERLRLNPEIGRLRFRMDAELTGTRSWRILKPFHRFLVFYRIRENIISVERLLEGHSRDAAGN